MDVPNLSIEEIQKRITDMLSKLRFTYYGFISEKLGADAANELGNSEAKFIAETIRQTAMKEKGALKLAMYIAIHVKNLHGSKVDVSGNENEASVTLHECSYICGDIAVGRKRCCVPCSTYYKKVAEYLGLKAKWTTTEKGCKFVFFK